MTDRAAILAVDTNRRNLELLTQQLDTAGYRTRAAGSLEEFDRELGGASPIGLVLIDLTGFDERIWERCERLRHADVPFVVLTARRSPTIQREGIRHGASTIAVKPLPVPDLLEFIRTLVET